VSERPTLHRIVVWGPVVAYLALIYYLSSRSQAGWAGRYPDSVLHACEYAALAVLLARALNDGLATSIPGRRLALTWVLCVLYALSDEFHQAFVPNRISDWRDVVADAVGAFLGLLVAAAIAGRLRRRELA
jgi:VanZ family protein